MWLTNFKRRWISKRLTTLLRQALAQHVELNESLVGGEGADCGRVISVPVQTGNSGGPLLDENGNLVGVVVAKLGMAAARATGDLPQNVSYAVKSAYALALLEPYLDSAVETKPSSEKLRFEDMVAKAQQSAVLILVY